MRCSPPSAFPLDHFHKGAGTLATKDAPPLLGPAPCARRSTMSRPSRRACTAHRATFLAKALSSARFPPWVLPRWPPQDRPAPEFEPRPEKQGVPATVVGAPHEGGKGRPHQGLPAPPRWLPWARLSERARQGEPTHSFLRRLAYTPWPFAERLGVTLLTVGFGRLWPGSAPRCGNGQSFRKPLLGKVLLTAVGPPGPAPAAVVGRMGFGRMATRSKEMVVCFEPPLCDLPAHFGPTERSTALMHVAVSIPICEYKHIYIYI